VSAVWLHATGCAPGRGGVTARGCGVQFAGISDTGKVRANNEDSYCLGELPSPAGGSLQVLLAVADGLGGERAGEVASALAIRTLRSVLGSVGGPWPQRLERSIVAAHEAILLEGRAEALRGMGTTLTAAVVSGMRVYWGHVGDSRAYLVRDGTARSLTRDHSVAQEMLASGQVEQDVARRHRHVLTRALGAEGPFAVDTGELDLVEGDWVLLTTDGLTALVADAEIAAVVQGSETTGACCQRLVALANERGGPDNITVVALRA
jgi:serine/threonine protein phosphatase PrpC